MPFVRKTTLADLTRKAERLRQIQDRYNVIALRDVANQQAIANLRQMNENLRHQVELLTTPAQTIKEERRKWTLAIEANLATIHGQDEHISQLEEELGSLKSEIQFPRVPDGN